MKQILKIVATLVFLQSLVYSQVTYQNQEIFLSGGNVAWINFASDIGPGYTNLNKFKSIFEEVSQNGGNSMRLWLHTNGADTPEFDANGFVIGPGEDAIDDLKNILDLAWENEVGLVLCLWSFDMLRIRFGETITDRSMKMLTDTTYLRAYVNNSLIPMVTELKDHPGILAWEVFNEPEGMSNEFGWDFNYHVPMSDIQRFINWVSGTIHRIDNKLKVTNGSWSFLAHTDVSSNLSKLSSNNLLSKNELFRIEAEFEEKYGINISGKEIIDSFLAAENYNYYSDSRLISIGGDSLGYLDFYTVHYYDWAGTALSPFHHPYDYWQLDKELVIAEFFLNDLFGLKYSELFPLLINNGYAGALGWDWNTNTQRIRMNESMNYLFENYSAKVDFNPKSGTIYNFIASKSKIQNGDSVKLSWQTSGESIVTLNGISVGSTDSIIVTPEITTTYLLSATGEISQSKEITVEILPTGKIINFTAIPPEISLGDSVKLSWVTTIGSEVRLNNIPVSTIGEMIVYPTVTTDYILNTIGSISETKIRSVNVLEPEFVNRAINREIEVSSINEEYNNNSAANIVDGDLTTTWHSDLKDLEWFSVDLVDTLSIKNIQINWGAKYASSYRIGFSNNNNDWQLVYQNQSGDGQEDEIFVDDKVGRFIKVLLDKSVGGNGFSVDEFKVYGIIDKLVDVQQRETTIPLSFSLEQNYPNPFNPETTIKFEIKAKVNSSKRELVNLSVYDLLGRKVKTIIDQDLDPGQYKVKFNTSIKNNILPSGIYYYKLISGSEQLIKKMILLK